MASPRRPAARPEPSRRATADADPSPDEDFLTGVPIELLTGRLSRDVMRSAATLSMAQIRGLVDSYYQIQDYRKSAANQQRAAAQGVDLHPVVQYVFGRLQQLEHDIQRLMGAATEAHVESRWMRSLVGIGPVLAAGFLAHLDVSIGTNISKFWAFAGLNPARVWLGREKARDLVSRHIPERGDVTDMALQQVAEAAQYPFERIERWSVDSKTGNRSRAALIKSLARRPWNADLKVLAWKCSESFVKFSNHRRAPIYSRLYRERKALEQQRNDAGLNKDTAARALQEKRYGTDTEAYKAYIQGVLPKGQIDMRARRFAVKIFLGHLHNVMHETTFGQPSPLPYIVAMNPETRSVQYPVPNWPLRE